MVEAKEGEADNAAKPGAAADNQNMISKDLAYVFLPERDNSFI